MDRALALAARGDYRTRPNPRVGAVVVRDGEVVAEGWHQRAGGPHAEAAALAALAPGGARGATLYVTLEPCGPRAGKRTPPCVDAVLAAGFARVVVATPDPHPQVDGRSLERLRAAGVRVEVGLRGQQARLLNGPFAKWVTRGVPYVTAKWAMSLDGKIACATGHSQWISGPASRRRVHALRGEVDAVAVGVGTALADDPALTRRDAPGGDPLRVVVDSRGRLPLTARLVQEAARPGGALLATTPAAPADHLAALSARGVEVLELPADPEGRVDLRALLSALAGRGVRHLLVEGGGGLLGGLFDADLVDQVEVFLAGSVLGGAAAPTPVAGQGAERVDQAPRLRHLAWEPSGEDLRLIGHVHEYGGDP